MNKLILFISMLFTGVVHAQTTSTSYRGADGIPQNIQIVDAAGRPLTIGDHSNIDGSPLLQDEWVTGIIKLINGTTIFDSSLNYSLYRDQLFFKRYDRIYPVTYPVKEFFIGDAGNGDKDRHFKNGFPATGGHDSTTFYEILSGKNNIQLLKWEHKKVSEVYTYGSTYKSEYVQVEELYAYLPAGNKLVSLGFKPKVSSLKKDLASSSASIDDYLSTHAFNIKKEDDLVKLFSFLDSTGD